MEGIASVLRKCQSLANMLQILKHWALLVRILISYLINCCCFQNYIIYFNFPLYCIGTSYNWRWSIYRNELRVPNFEGKQSIRVFTGTGLG